jgi:hypothetical protein
VLHGRIISASGGEASWSKSWDRKIGCKWLEYWEYGGRGLSAKDAAGLVPVAPAIRLAIRGSRERYFYSNRNGEMGVITKKTMASNTCTNHGEASRLLCNRKGEMK